MIYNNYCAFSKDHKCIQWMDYELTRHELAEANELCHGNWIEIQHLREYIDVLKAALTVLYAVEIYKDHGKCEDTGVQH